MIRVTVRTFPGLERARDTVFHLAEPAAVSDLLALAAKEFPPAVSPPGAVLLNGTNILHLQGQDTPLKEGDVVAIVPTLTGGGGPGGKEKN